MSDLPEWVFAAERAYVAAAVSTAKAAPQVSPSPEARARALAAAGAIASRYLAVGTPRSFGIIIEDSTDVELAALALAAHRAWFAPRDLRCAASHGGAAELAEAIGGRVVTVDEALACDIANVYAPLALAPGQLRRGTHVNVNAAATLAPELVATIVHEAGLPALAAGLVDGRQLDELTIFFADGAPIALSAI